MSKRLFVGNLSYDTREDDLRNTFAPYGCSDVHMPTDQMSGRPRGFAFVTVEDDKAAQAISDWNEKDLGGRALSVNEAKPREERGSGGGGGNRGGGSGGGYGSGGYERSKSKGW